MEKSYRALSGSLGDRALKQKLKPFEAAKSTLHFPLDVPLPLTLITQVVKSRINENLTALNTKQKK